MTRDEMDRASDWLRDEAERLEKDEPYATVTIAGLRTAADHFDYADAEEDN